MCVYIDPVIKYLCVSHNKEMYGCVDTCVRAPIWGGGRVGARPCVGAGLCAVFYTSLRTNDAINSFVFRLAFATIYQHFIGCYY